MHPVIAVSLGSIAGGLARYYLTGAAGRLLGNAFPVGTLIVNIAGCLLIGIFSTLAETRIPMGPQGKLLLTAGFCGAFTTFSTFMLETDQLLQGSFLMKAGLYVFLSLVFCFAAFRLGVLLAYPYSQP